MNDKTLCHGATFVAKRADMAKIHYGQETPRDQLLAQIGAIRGEMQNVVDDVSYDPKRNARHVLFLLELMEGVLPHVKDANWNQSIPRGCEVDDDDTDC